MNVALARALALALVALLTACGGGGGGGGGSDNTGNTTSAPTALTYPSPQNYIVGSAIAALSPTVTNTVTAYSVSPALPAGLVLNTSTGVIAGTPTAVSAQSSYAITASNSAGSTTFSLVLSTVAPAASAPTSLSYPSPSIFVVNTVIAALSPTVVGTVTSYTVAPSLPAGLTINATTGQITGTPTAVTAQANHTITASNSTGSATFVLVLTVQAVPLAPPTGLSYPSPHTFPVGTGIAPLNPTVTGTVTRYSVAPPLPAGLTLFSNGQILGAPLAVTATAVYTVTAENAAGSTSFGVTLTIVAPPPPSLSLTSFTSSVNPGRDGTLSWRTTGALNCTAFNGWSGQRAVSGDEHVPVSGNVTRYEMTCTGLGGSVTDAVEIRRSAFCRRPDVAFDATPRSVTSGTATTLRWYTANAATCAASGGWSGQKTLMDSETTAALTTDTTFALTCDGDAGQTVAALGVGINRTPPKLYFQSRFKEIDTIVGAVLPPSLSWTTTDATSCMASGGWSGAKAWSGALTVPAPDQSTPYTLQCSGPGGTTAATLSIAPVGTANAPPVGQPDVIAAVEGQPFERIMLGDAYFANDTDPDGCIESFVYAAKSTLDWAQWATGYFEEPAAPDTMWFKPTADISGDLVEWYAPIDNVGRAGEYTRATFRVAPIDDVPTTVNDIGAVMMNGGPIWLGITRNDRGLDQPYNLTITRQPNHGTALTIANVARQDYFYPAYYSVRYVPTVGYAGTDSLDYQVTDPQGQTATATVTISVLSSACVADGTYTAPLGGTFGVDWRTIQFADTNLAVGTARDAQGGVYAKDQSSATTFLIGDLDDIYSELPVVAMQCGRVVAITDNGFDANPASDLADALASCGSSIVIERSDGTRDRYCNMRVASVDPNVGDTVLEGQYIGRAGASGGYPGLRVDVVRSDGSGIDLFSVGGGFPMGYPTAPEVLGFGVTVASDPRSGVETAYLKPAQLATFRTVEDPVIWYRIFGVPSSAARTLLIEDNSGAVAWQRTFTPPASANGVFAYATGNSNDFAIVDRPPSLPVGSYVARISVAGYPTATTSASFQVTN